MSVNIVVIEMYPSTVGRFSASIARVAPTHNHGTSSGKECEHYPSVTRIDRESPTELVTREKILFHGVRQTIES